MTIPQKIIASFLVSCGIAAALSSCTDDDKLSPESVITADRQEYTEFDCWLQRNFVAAYNIRFKYRYEDIESDMNYTTVPISPSSSSPSASGNIATTAPTSSERRREDARYCFQAPIT